MNDSRSDKPAQRPIRDLPLHWKLWFTDALVVALYMLTMILHWTNALEQLPLGLSAIAHTVILGLFFAGCVAILLDRLDAIDRSRRPVAALSDETYMADVAEAFQLGKQMNTPPDDHV